MKYIVYVHVHVYALWDFVQCMSACGYIMLKLERLLCLCVSVGHLGVWGELVNCKRSLTYEMFT